MRRSTIVTGGGTGIGRATALAFSQAGDDVLIVGRRAAVLQAVREEAAAAGHEGSVDSFVADLRRPDDVDALATHIAASDRFVDVLVNNAGGNADNHRPNGTPSGASALGDVARRWEDNWRLNVLTAALTTTAVAPQLRDGKGRVVMVSSIAAHNGGGASYGAAKSALHAYTYSIAADFGKRGITANVVAPGYIADTEFFADRLDAAVKDRLVDQTLTGRAGRPSDVASAILWLTSPGAAHVTGEIIRVNGGADLGL